MPRRKRTRMTDGRDALIPADEARAMVGGWLPDGAVVTPTSLRFTEPLEYDVWERFGRDLQWLRQMQEARLQTVQWWVGDWLLWGRHAYGEKFAQAVVETGKAERTLANLQWVASAFDPSRRRESLKFGHHAEVAALPEADQEDLLDEAEYNGYSVKDLRDRVHDRKAENDGKDPAVERARRMLERALPALRALDPEQWAGVVVAALVWPLRHDRPEAEYYAFLTEFRRQLEELEER
jgi:hypothetical protein